MSIQKIAIATDSSAFVPAETRESLGISVIPLWLIWEGENLRDGIDIQPSTFYRRLKESPTLPTSSQPTAKEFVDFYLRLAGEADAIVSILASSKISGTVASAQAARELLPHIPIYVVDSLSSSVGQGLIVLAAARGAAEGQSPEEVVQTAERIRDKVHLLFVVDTLEYLHRGGRISGGKRLLGTALQIKPLLHFQDGLITPLAQARTKRKAVAKLMETIETRLSGRHMVEAAVVDIDCPEDGEAIMAMVKERFNPSSLFRGGVSPVVGTHVGPGACGIAFYDNG